MLLKEKTEEVKGLLQELSSHVENISETLSQSTEDINRKTDHNLELFNKVGDEWKSIDKKIYTAKTKYSQWSELELIPSISFEEVIAPLEEEFETIMETMSNIDEKMAESFEAYFDFDNQLKELREAAEERLNDIFEGLSDKMEAFIESIEEDAGSAIGAIGNLCCQTVKECGNEVEDAITNIIYSTIQEILENMKHEMLDFSKVIEERKDEVVTHFKDQAKDKVNDALKKEADHLVENALSSVTSEIQEHIMISQISSQISSSLTPILPPLLAARVLAKTIRIVMEKMMLA